MGNVIETVLSLAYRVVHFIHPKTKRKTEQRKTKKTADEYMKDPRKIIHVNGGGKYEVINDHRSYIQNLIAGELKPEKYSGLNRIRNHQI